MRILVPIFVSHSSGVESFVVAAQTGGNSMKRKYRFALDLQQFAEGETEPGVEVVPAAEEQVIDEVDTSSETGEESQVAAEPEKQNNFEKAFAKRLAAKEAEMEAKYAEKYKDYEVLQKATAHLQKTTGISDLMTLKEELELADLQERAETQNLDVDTLKRIEQLEQKAAKGDALEAKYQQEQQRLEFETSLKTFCEGKEINGKAVDHNELWNFMHENEINKPEIAFKAMKADLLEAKLATAKEDSIKDYLASKQAPRFEGNNGAAGSQSVDTSKMSWKELERHTSARLAAARTPQ